MTDPAKIAANARWRARNKDKVRKAQRIRDARKTGTLAKRIKDQNWRDRNREVRALAIRCGVSVKVARMWIAEGRVPPYKHRGYGA